MDLDGLEDEEEIFEVERILKRKIVHGKVFYLVRWKGFGSDDDTWEPENNLDGCREIIREYIRDMSKRDLSPRITRRRTKSPSRTPVSSRTQYTRLKRHTDTMILHLKDQPPTSPIVKVKEVKAEELNKVFHEDEKPPLQKADEKPVLLEKTPIENHPARIFVLLAALMIFGILLLSFFKPVET